MMYLAILLTVSVLLNVFLAVRLYQWGEYADRWKENAIKSYCGLEIEKLRKKSS